MKFTFSYSTVLAYVSKSIDICVQRALPDLLLQMDFIWIQPLDHQSIVPYSPSSRVLARAQISGDRLGPNSAYL